MSDEPILWRFEKIEAVDVHRAEALQVAPSRIDIVKMVASALRTAVSNGDVRIGCDESGANPRHLRAIIQFHVGRQLFDWFFNAHTGYRAQFRHRWEDGHAYNAELVYRLRDELKSVEQKEITVRRLNALFEDCGTLRSHGNRILDSLDPELSKVWFCKKLIRPEGGISILRVDLSGPRLTFNDYDSWGAPYAQESDAWLDLKGAFLGGTGLYQIKDPIRRAKDLQYSGSA